MDRDVKANFYDNVFRSFVESVISELSKRFNSHFQKVAKISNLIPLNIVNTNITCPSVAKSHFDKIIEMYNIDLLQPADIVSQEIFMLAVKCKDTNLICLHQLVKLFFMPNKKPNQSGIFIEFLRF